MSTRDLSYDDAAELAHVAKRWWLFLLSGILWILFAFVVLTFDLTTVWAVAVFFGIGLIAGGVTELVVASQAPSWKWLHVMVGVISIVAGLVALAWPGQTFLVLAAVIGWYLLFAGLFDVVAAFATKDENEIWWLQLILGITQILIGFWAVGYAGRSIAVLVIWVGAAALSRGISSLFLAFGLRKAGKELQRLNPA